MSNPLIKKTYIAEKVSQRIKHLSDKKDINILNCFTGQHLIWNEIKRKVNKNIKTVCIDFKSCDNMSNGDNVKFLRAMNLNKYDIIDLDTSKVPYSQLKIIFEKRYQGFLFVTFNQARIRTLPLGMLEEIGYSKTMIQKCPTLFARHGIEKFKQYLAKHGVKKIHIIKESGNINHIFVSTKEED